MSTLEKLRAIAAGSDERPQKAKKLAELIRTSRNYRWVGIYDVDVSRGNVSNLAWCGPEPPVYPVFRVTQGLTAVVIATRTTLNIGNLSRELRDFTNFGNTRSEIIVPVLKHDSESVVGTIDVESATANAFDPMSQVFLENCALAIRKLWGASARPKAVPISRVRFCT